jgi:peroxiredoxin Q/BCP
MAAKSSSGPAAKKPAAKSSPSKIASRPSAKTAASKTPVAKTTSASAAAAKPDRKPVAAPPTEASGLKAGDLAPAFKLPGAGGETLSLAGFRGKKLVLYFYPKDDTSGCTKEAIEFNALKNDFAKSDTVVVGLSPDSVKSHDKFREKYGLAFPLAADEAKSTLEAYGVWIEKSMYGRKYMGVDRSTFLIDPKGRIAAVWRKVKVPGHAKDVLAAARAL